MSTFADEENSPSAEPTNDEGPAASDDPAADVRHTGAAPPRPPWTLKAAKVLLVLACVVGVTAAMAGFGSRWGLWHFRTGFTVLRWAVYGALGVTALTLPVLWITRPGRAARGGFLLALVALLVAAPVFVVPLGWRLRAGDVPPIHDITTDTNEPPRFEAILPLRADAPNPAEYPGSEVAEQQEEAYPDIRPALLDVPAGRAYERALAAARDMGWDIVDADAAQGRIEATDRTFWFGFTDDVVIRLTPSGDRTIVDVRSKSRVGRSDVGTNARRIREYLDRLTG